VSVPFDRLKLARQFEAAGFEANRRATWPRRSPIATAAADLATRTDLRDLEHRLNSIILATATTLFPDHADDPRFPALLDGAISVIRGLVIEIPIWGVEVVTARWEAVKPILADAAARLLDAPS